MLIFEKSRSGRRANAFRLDEALSCNDLPAHLLRKSQPDLPALSELQVVRHFTQLSSRNFSIDTNFYPLGSCTMKYNPRAAHQAARMPGYWHTHPLVDESSIQGFLQCLYELQTFLTEVTGMQATSLAPMAGAQGEFAGVAMIAAYHRARGDSQRREMLVPDAAHGTNPASAVMCGYTVREIPTTQEGDVDIEALRAVLGPQTAGIMLTNPSTLGVFERGILQIAELVHEAGGLLYYDGANLNAILGKFRPGDMGFDVMHMNLHKTFATPHGGGGPGAGAVAAGHRLQAFLPTPMVGTNEQGYCWLQEKDRPQTIGRLSTFMGNSGVLLRAFAYAKMLGSNGLPRVAEYATLNANYLMHRLQQAGFQLAFPRRRASHEFIVTLQQFKKQYGVSALDFAKRLLDYGFHAPTIYFPLLVPECFLIEPTETETKQQLDRFVEAMVAIAEEARTNPQQLIEAPQNTVVGRLDEVKAARGLNLVWVPEMAAAEDVDPVIA